MSRLRPICVPCRLEMRCVKNDRVVQDPAVGGFPSTYWLGDEYECPECRARIVTGFGAKPAEYGDEPRDGEALQFDYERPTPAPLMLHLDLRGRDQAIGVSVDTPIRLPPGMNITAIDLGGTAIEIPLIAFGDPTKPIARGTVTLAAPRILHVDGRGADLECSYVRSLSDGLEAGTVAASLCLRVGKPAGTLRLLAISLELAAPDRAAQTQQQAVPRTAEEGGVA